MRMNKFIGDIQESFPVLTDEALARDISRAMREAQDDGSGRFTYDGMTYIVKALWVEGCINYNCNPATCYTDWTLTPDKVMK